MKKVIFISISILFAFISIESAQKTDSNQMFIGKWVDVNDPSAIVNIALGKKGVIIDSTGNASYAGYFDKDVLFVVLCNGSMGITLVAAIDQNGIMVYQGSKFKKLQ